MSEQRQFPQDSLERRDKDVIFLTKEECCAVQSAFGGADENVFAGLSGAFGARVTQILRYLGDVYPPEPLEFPVWEPERNIYAHIIDQELQRLQQGSVRFRPQLCTHTEADHVRTLKNVLKKISPVIN